MFKSWHTNLEICHCLLLHEHGKQNFVKPFIRSRKLLRYTHAWTKFHKYEVMSWIFGAYECHYAWLLPEVNSTTVSVWFNGTVVIVYSVPPKDVSLDIIHRWIMSPFVQFKYSVYGRSYWTYMYTSWNAVLLVWGSLRLAPTSSISSLWLGSPTRLSLIAGLNYWMDNWNENYCILKLIHIIHLL